MNAAVASSDAHHLRAVESLLAFWADAGVDALCGDTPHDRSQRGVAPEGVGATAPSRRKVTGPEETASATAAPLVEVRAPTCPIPAESAQDLDTLAEYVASAAGPEWRGYRFYRGDPRGVVAFVVDPPDADDRREGRPFCAGKGRLLDGMIAAAGLAGRTLVLNASLRSGPGPGADPDPECKAFVEQALALARPNAVVAAGQAAVRLFFASGEPMPRLRGRWTVAAVPGLDGDVPVLASFSPTLLLVQPGAKKLAWRDIMTLQRRLEDPRESVLG